MARAMCCDRCGEFFKYDEKVFSNRKYRLIDHDKRNGSMYIDGEYIDICDKCYEKFKQFMENKDFLYPNEIKNAVDVLEHGDGTVIYSDGTVEQVIKED